MTDTTKRSTSTTAESESIAGPSRRTILKATAAIGSAFALSDSASAGDVQEDDDSSGSNGDVSVPYLDLDTLEAEFEGETLQAEPYEEWRPGSTTYVGDVPGWTGRDLFVGVSLLDGTEQSDGDGQPGTVAYMCDGEPGGRASAGLHLSGEYDAGGVTLTPEDAQEVEDAEVKLAMVGGEVLGAATLPDRGSFPFLAVEATDDAGLYWAEIDPEEETSARWVVLPDGRQRGTLCFHVYPCAMVCNWEPP